MAKNNFVKVLVNIPEKLMKLVKERDYFGLSPERFWTECVRAGVACSVNCLEFDEMQRVIRKVGKNELLTVLGSEGEGKNAISI